LVAGAIGCAMSVERDGWSLIVRSERAMQDRQQHGREQERTRGALTEVAGSESETGSDWQGSREESDPPGGRPLASGPGQNLWDRLVRRAGVGQALLPSRLVRVLQVLRGRVVGLRSVTARATTSTAAAPAAPTAAAASSAIAAAAASSAIAAAAASSAIAAAAASSAARVQRVGQVDRANRHLDRVVLGRQSTRWRQFAAVKAVAAEEPEQA
jgi:hypothetical protein